MRCPGTNKRRPCRPLTYLFRSICAFSWILPLPKCESNLAHTKLGALLSGTKTGHATSYPKFYVSARKICGEHCRSVVRCFLTHFRCNPTCGVGLRFRSPVLVGCAAFQPRFSLRIAVHLNFTEAWFPFRTLRRATSRISDSRWGIALTQQLQVLLSPILQPGCKSPVNLRLHYLSDCRVKV